MVEAYHYGGNMKTQELRSIIEQIKRYNLTNAFSSPEDLDKWLENLNNRQIRNLITLDINPEELTVPRSVIINENILNCEDYKQKLKALSKVQNCDGFYHLFDRFCSIYFLRQPSFYEDVKLISEADTAKYALWVIGEESFNKSPYRKEDLKMILGAKDKPKEYIDDFERDWLVAESLAIVAKNKNSINSKYHKEDMELISISGSDCLQMSGSYPDYGLNKLAINEVSLSDPYHLENMQILAENPVSQRYLYLLMTDKDFIKRETYRQEIDALRHAKSEVTALAMYNFIVNPKIDSYHDLSNIMQENNLNYLNAYYLGKNDTVLGSNHPNYIQSLYMLNEVDDEFVLFFASLLADKNLMQSGYQEKDLELLFNINDEGIFLDLYLLMTDEISLKSTHHLEDVKLISEEETKKKRKLYLAAATDKVSLSSPNHRYDMEYIHRLEIEELDKKFMDTVHYYLYNNSGIKDPRHVEKLEKLYNGTPIEELDEIAIHLSQIEENIEEYIQNQPKKKGFLSRILRRK